MKRMTSLFMTMLLLTAVFISVPVNAHGADWEAGVLPRTAGGMDLSWQEGSYPNYAGRLYVSSVGLNVGLYEDGSQYACDRLDSACFFSVPECSGTIIADHSNQEFSVLTGIAAGDIGKIIRPDGSVIYIRCAEVLNGHNTGDYITDGDYNIIMGRYDYLMYTCMEGWQNVRVCQWQTVGYGTAYQLLYDSYAQIGPLMG